MADVPRYVVDASVAVKWHLRDEEYADQALALRDELEHERGFLIAPEHIYYEVSSAVRNAVRVERISPRDARVAFRAFLEVPIATVPASQLVGPGLDQALK